MSKSSRFDTCNHLDGKCAVVKRKGSSFCQHHCCPWCFGDKSSQAPMCAVCAKEKNLPMLGNGYSGHGLRKQSPHPNSGHGSPGPGGEGLVRIPSSDSPAGGIPMNNANLHNGVKRFQDVAQRLSQGRRKSEQGPALNVSPNDAGNLQLMFKRGLLTAEQYALEMVKLQQLTSQMFEKPTNTPKSTKEINGGCTALVDSKNFEMVYKYTFDYALKKWDKSVLVVSIERIPFAEGNLRRSYKMRDLTKPDGEDLYVAKASKDKYEDTATYFLDIEMQCMCRAFAEEYNRRNPPKKVEFLEAYLIECFQRPDSPLFACEPFIDGKYVKYSNNWGFVSPHDRNTPHTFSHFTYHLSGGKFIVVDVQGVGDKYTDPQMHSIDGKGFGKGNCGQEGIEKFFATHKCNVLCKMLGLTDEVKCMTGTMAPGFDFNPKKRISYDDVPSVAELAYYGITEQDYKLLVNHFRAVDKDKSGEINLQELGMLCKALNLKVSPKHYIQLVQQIDSDRNGRITLQEFLAWWTGHCGGVGGAVEL